MQDRLERFLARLLTDRAFREAFIADPGATGRREGLSADQCRAVAAMPLRDLRTAARSYDHKNASGKPRRLSFASHLLSLLRKAYPALSSRIASSRSNR